MTRSANSGPRSNSIAACAVNGRGGGALVPPMMPPPVVEPAALLGGRLSTPAHAPLGVPSWEESPGKQKALATGSHRATRDAGGHAIVGKPGPAVRNARRHRCPRTRL